MAVSTSYAARAKKRAENRRGAGNPGLRVFAIGLLFFGALCAFGALNVLLKSVLYQQSLVIADLQQQIDKESELSRKLNLELAELKKPERVLAIAKKLGMTQPTNVTYLRLEKEKLPKTIEAQASATRCSGSISSYLSRLVASFTFMFP